MAGADSEPNAQDIRAAAAVPPEVVAEALRTFDERATIEEVRRLKESGGLALADFYGELEQIVLSASHRP